MLAAIRQDLRRCGRSPVARLKEVAVNPAMWAVFGYRVRRAVADHLPRPVRWLLAPVTIPLQVGLELLTQVQLSGGARIGPGLYLPHLGTIVVGSGAVVGAHCTLAHGVTLGHGGGRTKGAGGFPTLGDRVYVGPGAAVLGPIAVGDDALVGAGAVVVKPVPARAVVAGNPARVLGLGGSFALIDYPGMEHDPARAASLALAAGGAA